MDKKDFSEEKLKDLSQQMKVKDLLIGQEQENKTQVSLCSFVGDFHCFLSLG